MTETSTHTLGNGATKRLERSRSDRKLAGVCGGLARYFDIHPAVYRVAFVVLTLLGGAGILIYLTAALVMPEEGHEDSFATAALVWSLSPSRCCSRGRRSGLTVMHGSCS
jgi:phage shock protein C